MYFHPYQGNLKPEGEHPEDARRDNRPLRQGLGDQAEAEPEEAEAVRRREEPNPHKGQDQPNHLQLGLRGEHLGEEVPNAPPILGLQRQRA